MKQCTTQLQNLLDGKESTIYVYMKAITVKYTAFHTINKIILISRMFNRF